MLSKMRSRLSYANVVASVALFIALGGTSYGLATGSIDSREIKNNAVRGKDVRNNDVRSRDIRAGTLRSSDVKNGALLVEDFKAGQLPAGERGPEGQPGPQGQQGPAGRDATKLFAYIQDPGSADAATVHYGSGVTAVDDPPGNSSYMVTFDRSMVNCVVQAVAGVGDPPGDGIGFTLIPTIAMFTGDDRQVTANFQTGALALQDTSFLITAFC